MSNEKKKSNNNNESKCLALSQTLDSSSKISNTKCIQRFRIKAMRHIKSKGKNAYDKKVAKVWITVTTLNPPIGSKGQNIFF